MKIFFLSNWPIKLLAIAMAVVFWFLVLSNENTFYIFPDNLTIQAFNVPEGLAVLNDLGSAKVTVRAESEVFKSLTPEHFTVYVDLQGLAAGSKTVDVIASSTKSEVSILDINPPRVEVVLESITTKEVPLTIQIEGEPAANYIATLDESPLTVVTVSGAESVLETVEGAVAVLTLNGSEMSDVAQTASLTIMDAQGNPVSNVIASPSTLELTAEVELEQSQKLVGVRADVGEVSGGWVSSVSVVPSVVLIEGDAEILNQIDYLETEPLAPTLDSGFFEGSVGLILPTGVSLAEGEPSMVEVSFIVNRGTQVDPNSNSEKD